MQRVRLHRLCVLPSRALAGLLLASLAVPLREQL